MQHSIVAKFKTTRKLGLSQFEKHNYCVHYKLKVYFDGEDEEKDEESIEI